MAKNGGRKGVQGTRRSFKCKTCKERFRVFGDLQRHERAHLIDFTNLMGRRW